MTTCPECNDTGERDSGGTHPWGEPVYLPCDCKNAEIGRRWHEDSSLEKWFPLTAERLAALEADPGMSDGCCAVCGAAGHREDICPWRPHEYGNWSPIGLRIVPVNAGPGHPPADNDEGSTSQV